MTPEGAELATRHRSAGELDARADALRALVGDGVPFVVAGAYAFFEYTGIFRDTKDLDLFLRRRDLEGAFAALERTGFRTELTDPVWIGKGYRGEWFVDLIFSSGNGVAVVDDAWFEHARRGEVMGVPALLAPPEEMIWSKAFVCERERYDGHDVANLIRACGPTMDFRRLLERFGDHWEVLLGHLVMYRFSFPTERTKVPEWVMRELLGRAWQELAEGDCEGDVCRGTLLSQSQYEQLLERHAYRDVRAVAREAACSPAAGGDDGGVSPGGDR